MFALDDLDIADVPSDGAVWSDAEAEWFAQATHSSAVDERDRLHETWFRAQNSQLDVADAVADFDRVDAHSLDGARTKVSWLRSQLQISHAHATRMLAQARGLRTAPQLRTAVFFGALTFDHADCLIRMFTPARSAHTERDVDLLIDQV